MFTFKHFRKNVKDFHVVENFRTRTCVQCLQQKSEKILEFQKIHILYAEMIENRCLKHVQTFHAGEIFDKCL